MSMIKCPECGNEMSSMAKTCPHCGCEITVCPDCGAVYAGSKTVCDTCGCKLAAKESAKSEAEVKAEHTKTTAKLRLYPKIELAVVLVMAAVFLATLIGTVVLIEGLGNLKSSANMLDIKSKCDDARVLIAVTALFGCLFMGFASFFGVIMRKIFSSTVKHDRETYKKYFLQDNPTKKNWNNRAYLAIEYLEIPERTLANFIASALVFAVMSVSFILLGVWATKAVDEFWFNWLLVSTSASFKLDFRSVYFVVGIILFFVGTFANTTSNQILHSKSRCDDLERELAK